MSDPRASQPPHAAGPPPTAAPSQPIGKPLQYSMRSLLIVMTLVAIISAAAGYAGVPELLMVIGLIGVMFVGPVCVGTLALYSRGYRQTFFLGAFVGALSPFYLATVLRYGPNLSAVAVLGIAGVTASAACGLAALFTRRILERRGWHLPPDRDDSHPGD